MQVLRRRSIALICLLAYALGGTPVLGSLFAWAGSRDCSHELTVVATEDGERVVLHHAGHSCNPQAAHHDWLCNHFMAACEQGTEGDHVFQQHGLTNQCLRAGKDSSPSALPAPAIAEPPFVRSPAPPACAGVSLWRPSPRDLAPPPWSGLLASVRLLL